MSEASETDASEQTRRDTGGMLTSDDVRTGYVSGLTFTNKAVQYAVVGDRAVFEGDIVLGTVDELVSRSAELDAVSLATGPSRAVVVVGAQFRWPNALMPYVISAALPNRARVTDAIAHWVSKTNMRFVERTAANAAQYPNWVEVIPSDGCWSQVGMRGGRQEIGLAGGCGFGATVHEFGHAWGLWHEQSREDRNSFVTINWANIEAGKEHNFNQHISDGDDVGPYNYGSIMHYGRFAFSKNNQPTIEPTQAGAVIGQRDGLSADDIAAVHFIYQTWHYNLTVDQVYATHHGRNAWVNLSGLGWRKLHADAADGVTNMLRTATGARVKGHRLHAFADGSTAYQLQY
ncbi:MAG: M12 family metallopeptidase [Pseudonocardia sp.]